MKKIYSIILLALGIVSLNASAVTFTLKFSNPSGVTLASKDIGSKVTVNEQGNGIYTLSTSSTWGNTVIFRFSDGTAFTSEDISVINEATNEPLPSSTKTWQMTTGTAFNITVGSDWEEGATYLVSTGESEDEDMSNSVILKFSDPSKIEKVTDGSSNSLISLLPDENGEIKFNINLAPTPLIYLREGYTIESVEDITTDTPLLSGSNWDITDNVVSFYLNYSINYGQRRVKPGDTIVFTTKEISDDDNGTTGIESVTHDSSPSLIFDIQGRKINKAENIKGLYIVNGKKVIIHK